MPSGLPSRCVQYPAIQTPEPLSSLLTSPITEPSQSTATPDTLLENYHHTFLETTEQWIGDDHGFSRRLLAITVPVFPGTDWCQTLRSDLKSQESDSLHSALGDWNQWPGSDASQFCWLFLKSLFVNHCIFSTTMRCCYLDRSAAADNGGVIDVWSTGCLHVIQCYSWWDLWKLLLGWWMLTWRY